METEIWKPIPDYPGYEASNLGNVRSWVFCKQHHGIVPHPIKGSLNGDGRFIISLYKDKKEHRGFVHRLVLSAFVGPCPPEQEGCHTDGNCQNNHLSNLRWDTHQNNTADDIRLKIRAGVRNNQAKIDDATVRSIREQYRSGVSQGTLTQQFGIRQPNISAIINGKRWKDAGGPIHQGKRQYNLRSGPP